MFKNLSDAVNANYAKMIADKSPMFLVDFDKEFMWECYLDGFQDATVKQSYNCNNCKSFFRRYAGIVALDKELNYVTIFDNTSSVIALDAEMSEDGMADAIKNVIEYIKSCPIKTIPVFQYNPKEAMGGVKSNVSCTTHIQWNHFNIDIPKQFIATDSGVSAASQRGTFSSKASTLSRCLDEIKLSDTELLIELIDQGSIYRGTEFRHMLVEFANIQKQAALQTQNKQNFPYLIALTASENITNIRNTAIGTLLVNIAEGMDLDTAVKKYESVTAPTNYKRPTALATPRMIEEGKKELQELGLLNALNRKFAVIGEININNVIHTFTKENVAALDIFDEMKEDVLVNPRTLSKVEEISISDFIEKVLPSAKSVQALVENRHRPNFVSLLTSQDPNEVNLFKWNNNFSWSYAGGIADSLREKVAQLGGRIDGVFRFSHSWNELERNESLMDLHVFMPGCELPKQGTKGPNVRGRRVGWNSRKDTQSGGVQDVDYTSEAPKDYIPVENITFPSLDRMPEGVYTCMIHNWAFRRTGGRGKAEIEVGGVTYQYEYPATKNLEWVTIAEVTLKNGEFTVEHKLDTDSKVASNKIWNIDTYKLHDVTNIMLSPNFWDDNQQGNKHFIFTLRNCVNDEQPRPFLNEFLRPELDKHRKLFEMLGGRVKIADDTNQLSGIGFSETLRNELIVKVTGNFERYLKIKF